MLFRSELDVEAYLPDDYIGQSIEKIRLYRELDNIASEAELAAFAARLADRFGAPPKAAEELFDVIRLRWACIALGFERAKLKNGLMILQFVQDGNSPYYKSPLFMSVLKYVTDNPAKFNFRQNNNKLSLTVRDITNTRAGVTILENIRATVTEKQ